MRGTKAKKLRKMSIRAKELDRKKYKLLKKQYKNKEISL